MTNSVPMDYIQLYDRIMGIDSKIRFVVIVDLEGRKMSGGQRDGISNHLSPDDERQSIRHAIDAWKLRMHFTGSIGKGKYAFAEYEKIKRITIPVDDKHLIYMTVETDADHTRIIGQILSEIQTLCIPSMVK